jgi:hypothetical protein
VAKVSRTTSFTRPRISSLSMVKCICSELLKNRRQLRKGRRYPAIRIEKIKNVWRRLTGVTQSASTYVDGASLASLIAARNANRTSLAESTSTNFFETFCRSVGPRPRARRE